MQGTEEVRREAEERVRTLVEKVEGEAVRWRRDAGRGALKAESDRIRAQAEQREERVRRAAEDEIKASASRARREVLAAADKTAPSWERREATPSAVRLPHLLDLSSLRPMREVRIRDTLSGELARPRPRPARSVSTPAARPSTAASTSATRVPSSSSPCSPGSCARRATQTRLVVNVTDINDKIYLAAGEAGEESGEFAARMTRAYFEDTESARTGAARRRAAGDGDDRRDRRADRRSDRSRPRLRVRWRRLLPRAQLRRLRQALQPSSRGHGPGRGGWLGLAEGGPARLRPLEGAQARRGHHLGLALGPGAARPGTSSARRWPRPSWAPSFAIHGGGSDLVFPHHENEIAQSEAAGRPFARVWMHNGMVETDAEKMSKSEGNIFQLSEALDRTGARRSWRT